MKTFLFILATLLASFCAFAQAVRPADSLSPEDLGGHKYIFEAQAAAGQVVVFRRERFDDGKLAERYDTISNRRDKNQVYEVLLLDLWTLSGGHAEGYTLKSPGSVGHIDTAKLHSADCSSNPPMVTLIFHATADREPAERKVVFTIFTESYQDSKHRFPNLPSDADPSQWWASSYFDEAIKK